MHTCGKINQIDHDAENRFTLFGIMV